MGNRHAVFQVAIQLCLRAVGLFKIVQELLRRAGQLQLLGRAGKGGHFSLISSIVGFLSKLTNTAAMWPSEHATRRHWAVMEGLVGRNDLSVFNMAPQLERLFLAFFLFTADVWNAVVNHFGPGLKGLACTGNSLIGAHKAFGNAVIPHQGMQSREHSSAKSS